MLSDHMHPCILYINLNNSVLNYGLAITMLLPILIYSKIKIFSLVTLIIYSVLTAAAMLGVAYPADLQMNHKTIHAFDMPSYKMTQHF